MNVLENLSSSGIIEAVQIFPAYDFAGSSSKDEMHQRLPDSQMGPNEWVSKDRVKETAWCAYWCGRTRASLHAAITFAAPIENAQGFFNSNTGDGWTMAAGSRTVFAISISGGTITQTEKSLIPQMIAGSKSDMASRNTKGLVFNIFWCHFESVHDLLKAFQGYGGIKPGDYEGTREHFGLPETWVDGQYNAEHDLLRFCHPDLEQVACLETMKHDSSNFTTQQKLAACIKNNDAAGVRSLIKLGADPNPEVFDFNTVEVLEELVKGGADVNNSKDLGGGYFFTVLDCVNNRAYSLGHTLSDDDPATAIAKQKMKEMRAVLGKNAKSSWKPSKGYPAGWEPE